MKIKLFILSVIVCICSSGTLFAAVEMQENEMATIYGGFCDAACVFISDQCDPERFVHYHEPSDEDYFHDIFYSSCEQSSMNCLGPEGTLCDPYHIDCEGDRTKLDRYVYKDFIISEIESLVPCWGLKDWCDNFL